MKHVLLVCFLLSSLTAKSQSNEINLEEFAERLFQIQDERISYEDIYESLLLLYTNKLNLNKAKPEDLNSLYLLRPNQIQSFFTYLDQNGPLQSFNELQVIPGFDLETIRALRPFVTVSETYLDPKPLHQRILREENNYFLLRYSRRLEQQVGYSQAYPQDTIFMRNNNIITDTIITLPKRYRGSANKLYGRFRTSHKGDFSLGFTFEKDAGERFEFKNHQIGFDFYSYHFFLENKIGFNKIILGDFQLQIGQGLIFGAGFGAGKGAETITTTMRNSIGIAPYTSVLESGFFRGIGIEKQVHNFKCTLFYSKLKQDGNIQSDTTVSDFNEYISSIQSSGFHRTAQELSLKDQIHEKAFGSIVEYAPTRKLKIGVSNIWTYYSTPIKRRPNNYNQFEFKGDHNYVNSAYFNYTWQNFTLFSEGGRSKSGGLGLVGGFVTSLSSIIDMSLVFRNYNRDFHSFYGNSFSEGSRNINERGTYWGLSITPNRRHKLNIYYDYFKFPWLRFRTEAPSDGYELLARYTYRPSKQVSLHVQVRQQNRQITNPSENLNILTDQVRRNYIFNINYEMNARLRLKTKVQSSNQQEGVSFTKGFAIIQDVNFDIWKMKFHTRIALFDTDNFNNAQYVYENDVLYSFSIPAYNGSGIRSYVMIRYDPLKNISLWARYARTTFPNTSSAENTIGSSLDTSFGDTASEIKMMLRVKL